MKQITWNNQTLIITEKTQNGLFVSVIDIYIYTTHTASTLNTKQHHSIEFITDLEAMNYTVNKQIIT